MKTISRLTRCASLLGMLAVLAIAFLVCWPATLGWAQASAPAGSEAPSAQPAPEEPPVRFSGDVQFRPELDVLTGVRGWSVNGEEISVDQVRDTAVAYVGPFILREMVASTLLRQEAKRRGISVTDAEVAAKAKQFREERGLSDEATFQRYLASEKRTATWFQDKVREYVLIEKVLSDQVFVSDSEVQAFYTQYRDAYRRPDSVWYRAMTFPTEAAAQAALGELRKGKAFQDIAKENAGSAYEKSLAGEVQTYQRGQEPGLPKEIEAALFSAPLTQVVGPLKTTFGAQDYYHLFKVEKKVDAHEFTLAEAGEIIRAELHRRKLEEQVYPKWLQTALSGASIEPLRASH